MTQVLGLGLGVGLDSVGRLSAAMLYTCIRYLRYSTTYDSDTKLADICSQMELVPRGYLFERIVAILASSAPVERVFSKTGLIVHPHHAKMLDRLLETLVFVKCSIFS